MCLQTWIANLWVQVQACHPLRLRSPAPSKSRKIEKTLKQLLRKRQLNKLTVECSCFEGSKYLPNSLLARWKISICQEPQIWLSKLPLKPQSHAKNHKRPKWCRWLARPRLSWTGFRRRISSKRRLRSLWHSLPRRISDRSSWQRIRRRFKTRLLPMIFRLKSTRQHSDLTMCVQRLLALNRVTLIHRHRVTQPVRLMRKDSR